MKAVLEKPTKAEQKFAKETVNGLEKISNRKKSAYRIYLTFQYKEKEELLEVPRSVIKYLRFLLGNIAEGKGVLISPIKTEMSTQEAADMLGVSRPFLVKLLERNEMPFKKVGKHRRINFKDLQAYERKQKNIRGKNLNFLAEEAQRLNLGYEV